MCIGVYRALVSELHSERGTLVYVDYVDYVDYGTQLFSCIELSVPIDGADEPYSLTVLDLDADNLKAAGD